MKGVMLPVLMIVGVMVFFFMALLFPALECRKAGGLPVLSVGYYGCAQPFSK